MASASAIGVLGGSFDPVHYGHLAIARQAFASFSLKKVLFVPAGHPPHKSSTIKANATHRLAMLRLALKGIDFPSEICPLEINRPGPSYTIDTLIELRQLYPGCELYFIIGSDNLDEIKTWHEYRKVLTLAQFCVTHRPGYPAILPPELSDATIRTFPSPEKEISSSMVRADLAQGDSCESRVPAPVLDYIKANGIYGSTRH
jgi:nicotinate-nucleotide adenylyltransferase